MRNSTSSVLRGRWEYRHRWGIFGREKRKLQGSYWQTDLSSAPMVSAPSPVVVDFGGSQSGNRCMTLFSLRVPTGLDWAGLGSMQLRGSLEQNTTKGTWEANFKEVWDDAWDKQLLSMCSTHQSSRYVWDLSKKGESAASASVDPHIPIAGVAEWPTSLDHILGFRGSLPHDWRACVPTRKWTCYTHVQLLQRGTATEIPMLNLGCRCEHILHSRFSHWSLPLSPIFPAGISCRGWICTKSASGDHTYNRHSY